ncbi:MAG: serpin family protein [Phenylobacterium sp.]|uniref:serpin family protein n=1 Tax=Phenylobacterium sp. TaxID=1871053 RepID=UPI0027214B24|nr:serpin family protein [Phenylobacterium sp.]MDO8409425.1 serpin family protein [Phenylobacterium sp.]
MKPILALAAPPLAALVLSACATTPVDTPTRPPAAVGPGGEAAPMPADLTGRALGVRLYDQLRAADDNVVISPVSLMGAFGVVSSGARGETRTAILNSLGLPQADTLNADLGGLLRMLEVEDGATTLSVANAVWVQRDFSLNPAFVQTAERDYGAQARTVDFQRSPQQAADEINAWVSGETRARIPELITASSINDATRLIVTNAVYFLGDWLHPFNASSTSEETFRLVDGSTTPIPLMFQRGSFRLLETDQFQAIDLPYDDARLSMTVLLPRKPNDLLALEAGLDAGLQGWLTRLDAEQPRTVQLYLPKIETALNYELVPQLTALGMGVAFTPAADFRGIADAPMAIGQVVHKTFLRIDEKGAEAAAATGIAIEVTSAPATPPPIFRADHPFLFLIRDRETGAVLFLGRISRPEAPQG